jgi:hypothetical protein
MIQALSSVVPYAALQVGVILIGALLWLDLRREARRRRLLSSIQSVLKNADPDIPGEKFFTRAA